VVFVALEIGKQDPHSVAQQDLIPVAEPEEIEEEVRAQLPGRQMLPVGDE
jgi:hypothetical protein